PNDVPSKARNCGSLEDHTHRCDQIDGFPASATGIGVDAAWHSQNAGEVECVKSDMEANHQQPEMPLAQSFAQHPSSGLWKPIVDGCKKRKEQSAKQHVVKVRDDEV